LLGCDWDAARQQDLVDRLYAKLFSRYYMEIQKGGFDGVEDECYMMIYQYWLGAYVIKAHAPSMHVERFVFSAIAPLVMDNDDPLRQLRRLDEYVLDAAGKPRVQNMSAAVLWLEGKQITNLRAHMDEFGRFVKNRMEDPRSLGLERNAPGSAK
jgi:hypothetical protein